MTKQERRQLKEQGFVYALFLFDSDSGNNFQYAIKHLRSELSEELIESIPEKYRNTKSCVMYTI
jgi:hypothetical protein